MGIRKHGYQLSDDSETGRTISDADVKAIVQELRKQLVADFYADLGRGVWSLVVKALVAALFALVIWGAAKDHHLIP